VCCGCCQYTSSASWSAAFGECNTGYELGRCAHVCQNAGVRVAHTHVLTGWRCEFGCVHVRLCAYGNCVKMSSNLWPGVCECTCTCVHVHALTAVCTCTVLRAHEVCALMLPACC
jgi:hypothetical protein